MTDTSLFLLGTSACHLCDQAEVLITATVENADECLQKVDISSSEALIEQYGTSIPVLRGQNMDGQWHELKWPFDQPALIRFLETLEQQVPDGLNLK